MTLKCIKKNCTNEARPGSNYCLPHWQDIIKSLHQLQAGKNKTKINLGRAGITADLDEFVTAIRDLLSERDALIKERDALTVIGNLLSKRVATLETDPYAEKCKYGIHPMTCDYVCTDPPVCPPGKRKDPKSL